MAGYANVPPMIGVVISKKYATLHELETVYGLEDLYNLYEIIYINSANDQTRERLANEKRKRGKR